MKKNLLLITFIFFNSIAFSQTWVQKQDFTGTARGFTASFAIQSEGKGYVVGGRVPDSWAYEKSTNSWSQIADYPGNNNGPVGFAIGSKGYVATGEGGSGANYFSNELYEYDPVANTWTARAPLPGPARTSAVAFTLLGKGYVGGGVNDTDPTKPQYNNALKNFYAYDPCANTWAQIADCPALGVNDAAIGFGIGKKGYVGTGGKLVSPPDCCASGPQYDFWEYDPALNTWSKKADFPDAGGRRQASGFATDSLGYICGGLSGNSIVKDFWQYDPVHNLWTKLTNFGGGARLSASEFVIGNSAYISGGLNYPTWYPDLWAVDLPSALSSSSSSSVNAAFSSSNPAICIGQSITFNDTSSFSPTNWQWSFPGGMPDSSTAENPVVQYDTAGTYNVTLSVWSGCSIATKTFVQYVSVSAATALSVSPHDTTVCAGSSITLSATGGVSYSWSPGLSLSNSTSANPVATPSTSTTYTVSGAGGCVSPAEVIVNVSNISIGGHVTAVRDTICQGTSGNIKLTGNSSNIIQWQSSSDNRNFAAITGADSSAYRTMPLEQSAWFYAQVGNGSCSTVSDTLKLYVPPTLTASFTTSVNGKQINFTSGSSGSISSYYWDFGDGQTSTEMNPVHTFSNDSAYNVCLTIYDGSNCSYTYCRSVSLINGVSIINAATGWNIYPNPFGNELYISAKQLQNKVTDIQLYDVLGRQVFNQQSAEGKLLNSLQINVSGLADGVYFLKIKAGEVNYVQRVVKQAE